MQFSKYQGTGNDFIMIDGRRNVMPDRSQKQIAWLCNRHFGIGADGLIILEESSEHDFRMVFYNADGKPGSMCGNGGRCIVAFARDLGLIDKHCIFEAPDGIHEASILENGNIQLSLNKVEKTTRIDAMYFINTGSPHLIVFVDNTEDVKIEENGKKLRFDPRFEGGTNVNFVQVFDNYIQVRTYERGVEAETLSCGTGVTACAIATYLKNNKSGNNIHIQTSGGELRVSFKANNNGSFDELKLTGPASKVFEGHIQALQ